MTDVAALFVQPDGCYAGLPEVDAWPEQRDARKYRGPWPVVAHPPCQLWGAFAPPEFRDELIRLARMARPGANGEA